jgi:ABC-type glycerol-3-phosphate transport system permease component
MSMLSQVRELDMTDSVWTGLRYVIIIALLGTIAPLVVYAISMSIRPASQFFEPLTIIPSEIELRWWRQAFSDLAPLLQNSYIRAMGSSIIVLSISIPASYVFARKQFNHKSKLFYLIVGVILFPIVILVVPFVVLFYRYGIYNSIIGLWFVDLIFTTPMAVWLLRDYFSDLPASLEEAAQVYGCTEFSAFVRVILPLAVPGILAVGFFTFVISWNEFLFANILTGQLTRPAIVNLSTAVSSEVNKNWGRIMAKTLIISLPPAGLYLFARQSLTEMFN